MRVLVTGAGGQVGCELVAAFAEHDVVAASHAQLDVGDRDAVLQAVTALRPDVIVHAAAWTDVDGCERDPERALRVNALGTRHVADAARRAGAHVVYLSTDYVFAGERRDRGYTEWDDPRPVNAYGASKLGGERELDRSATVVRTSWVCGRVGANFVKTVLRLAQEPGELRIVADQVGCPTLADDLAAAVYRLAVARLPGTFHVTNQRAVSWHEFACEIVAAAGGDAARVQPISTSELDPPRAAARPAWSVLDNAALRLSGLPLLDDHAEPLARLVKQLVQ